MFSSKTVQHLHYPAAVQYRARGRALGPKISYDFRLDTSNGMRKMSRFIVYACIVKFRSPCQHADKISFGITGWGDAFVSVFIFFRYDLFVRTVDLNNTNTPLHGISASFYRKNTLETTYKYVAMPCTIRFLVLLLCPSIPEVVS